MPRKIQIEREVKMINISSRRVMIERERAVDGARNATYSKFGSQLMENYTKPDKTLLKEIRFINGQVRRLEAQMRQQKNNFVKRSQVLNYDPMILVERPASPDVVKKALAMKVATQYGEEYENEVDKPRYMRQLRSKTRTPSTLTTIDAFTLKVKKKKNTWEDTKDQNEPLEFKSSLRPYAKLTEREKTDLQLGWSMHKPRLMGSDEAENEKKTSTKKPKKVDIKTLNESDDDDEFTPFITQMAKVRRHSSNEKTAKSMVGPPSGKAVRFSSKSNSARNTPVRKFKVSSTNIGGY